MSEAAIRARLYDGRTSVARLVHIRIVKDGNASLVIRIEGTEEHVALADVRIADRVGSIARTLQLKDGRSLEVIDNSAFDQALLEFGPLGRVSVIRRLEMGWRYAILAVLVIFVGTLGFIRYGAPMLAERSLRFIPPEVDAAIGSDGLRILDQVYFKPSTLSADRQARLQTLFSEVTSGTSQEGGRSRLELRLGGSIRANALALPSGIVVLTDELDNAAQNDDELRGVFAHEVGHLVNRHAMRRLVQSSSAALLLGGILGDVSGVSTLVTAVPTVLVDSAYSRDFEREADEFAFRWMSLHHVDPAELGNLLTRVTTMYGGDRGGFLASHPSLRERVKAAQASEPGAKH